MSKIEDIGKLVASLTLKDLAKFKVWLAAHEAERAAAAPEAKRGKGGKLDPRAAEVLTTFLSGRVRNL